MHTNDTHKTGFQGQFLFLVVGIQKLSFPAWLSSDTLPLASRVLYNIHICKHVYVYAST